MSLRINVKATPNAQLKEEPLPTDEDIESVRTKEDAERDGIDSETNLKEQLASRTFRFMEGFVSLIFVFLIYYVCYHAWYRLVIPKEVIIALITTSLAAVVGLVGFILKGLFGSK